MSFDLSAAILSGFHWRLVSADRTIDRHNSLPSFSGSTTIPDAPKVANVATPSSPNAAFLRPFEFNSVINMPPLLLMYLPRSYRSSSEQHPAQTLHFLTHRSPQARHSQNVGQSFQRTLYEQLHTLISFFIIAAPLTATMMLPAERILGSDGSNGSARVDRFDREINRYFAVFFQRILSMAPFGNKRFPPRFLP